jgi:hypothetical protein
MGGMMKGIGGLFAGVMAGIGVKDFLGDALAEARESQKVGALTANVIKTTGGAAKVTADQVGQLATALSQKTGIDDEAVQTGANLLLTFKNVRNEVGQGSDIFNRATGAALDLSKAGFGSVDGAAKMLGKALNDPIKGISALGRAGVTFTEQQKEQIKQMVKSGDVLGAQKIIMAEVESQVGGAAEATATAGDKARVTFDNLKESAGTKLLPIVDSLGTKFVTLVDEFQRGTGTGGELRDVVSKIGDVMKFLGDHTTATKVAVGGLVAGMVAWKAISTAVNVVSAAQLLLLKAHTVGTVENTVVTKAAAAGAKAWAATQWLLNAAMSANPIGLVILAIVALVAAVVIAYKNSETFRDIVNKAWKSVKDAISAVVTWFKDTAWPWLRDTVAKIAKGFTDMKDDLGDAWTAVKDAALDATRWVTMKFLDMVGAIIQGAADAFGWVPGLGDKLKGASKKFNDFKKDVNAALGGINDKKVSVGVSYVAGTRVVLSSTSSGGGRNTGGGSTAFRTGGVLPGYTPGRDIHRFVSPTGGILDLSGGEAIMRPEFTRLVGGLPGIQYLNDMARHGELPFSAFARGGVYPSARVPTRRGIDEATDLSVKDVVQASAKMLAAAFDGGGTAGGVGMGWRKQVAWARAHTPWAAITSTVRTGNPLSDHDRGRAIDLAGRDMHRTFETIRSFFNVRSVRSLYHSQEGNRQIRFNRYSDTPPHIKSTHYDHVHWAMARGGVWDAGVFDRGGSLQPGLNLVDNRTGAVEDLRPVGRPEHITVQVMLEDLKQLHDLQDFLDMLDDARNNGRKMASGRVSG